VSGVCADPQATDPAHMGGSMDGHSHRGCSWKQTFFLHVTSDVVHHQYNTERCDYKPLCAPLPGQPEDTAMAPLQSLAPLLTTDYYQQPNVGGGKDTETWRQGSAGTSRYKGRAEGSSLCHRDLSIATHIEPNPPVGRAPARSQQFARYS
jgi:hypothetical protein